MGFGPVFISWVQLLYHAPTVRIRANGLLSDIFDLHRGTRQGCPLSPLLFAIVIEPIVCYIRYSDSVMGFQMGQREERISWYADNILLYFGDMQALIPTVMEVIGTDQLGQVRIIAGGPFT